MRLIDADALKKAIIELDLDNTSHWSVIYKIDNAPTVERTQGTWVHEGVLYGGFGDRVLVNTCSVCQTSFIDLGKKYNFCPECGADNRGGNNND